MIAVGDIALDDARVLTGPLGTARLTKTEYLIVTRLAKSLGKLVSYDAVIQAMYSTPDDEPYGAENTLKVTMVRVRAKLALVGSKTQISTAWGEGYVINGPSNHIRILETPEEAAAVDRLLAEMRAPVASAVARVA